MSEKNKYNSKKSKPRGPKEENVGTYFTKNNLQFVSRRIPTLQEMIEDRSNHPRFKHIAAQFCKKVKAWDEVDTTVSDALQSENILEEKASDGQTDSTLEQSKMEKLVKTQDLSHLTDPEWVSDLFRISFTAPWSDGFTKVLREEGGTENISKGLDIPMSLMRSQRIDRNRVQKDRALLREAAKPKVAFGCAVPRARGLEEYEEQLKPHAAKPPHQLDPHKEHDLPMDLITMKAIWGDQLDSLSTKHYCRHLRELLRQKMDGTADPALSTVPMSQMKPKVLVEAGMLRTDESESHSSLSSLSSISSSSTTTQASTKRDK